MTNLFGRAGAGTPRRASRNNRPNWVMSHSGLSRKLMKPAPAISGGLHLVGQKHGDVRLVVAESGVRGRLDLGDDLARIAEGRPQAGSEN
jgi:hypothetical protein